MTRSNEKHARLEREGSFSTRPSGRGHFRGLEPEYDDECEKEIVGLRVEVRRLEEELSRLSAGRGKAKKYRDPEYLRVLDAKTRVETRLSELKIPSDNRRIRFLMSFLTEVKERLDPSEFNDIFEAAGKRAKRHKEKGNEVLRRRRQLSQDVVRVFKRRES